ncbi:MBL fold metallo-hydrolase [Candidatus Bathyarchaeota archaeon]|nr:MBL fold metallo-hydrolase [Candidatus Bathyarchaeota archaeon]MBS7628428.1 MBL fold metallo-hydrolase [Candidatus Bathyarchaeota archaeon]
MMIFKRFLVEGLRNFAYLIGDEQSREAVVVDPSGAVEDILEALREESLKLKFIINTHSHPDHTAGNSELAEETGAKILKYAPNARGGLRDGDEVVLGNVSIKVIYTPGHTPDSICLLVDNKLLTGDTLFVGECGRTDLPGGSSADLYDSLFNKLMILNDDVEVYPGHDYGERPDSTIGYERRHNYVLKPRTKEEFIRFMSE